MKDIMAVKQVSREEKAQVMEAIGRILLKKAHRVNPCLACNAIVRNNAECLIRTGADF